MKETMDIWRWDGGYGLGWFSAKIGEVGQAADNSLSNEMEKLNLRGLWEQTPTLKSVGDRICSACVDHTYTIKNKLKSWISSIEIAVHSQHNIMERVLNDEGNHLNDQNSQPTNESSNLNLISLGYVRNMPIASRSSIILGTDLETVQDVAQTIPLKVCDFEGKACNLVDRHQELKAVLLFDDGEEADISVSRAVGIGEYNLCIRPMRPGRATLSVKLHGVDVAQSPRKIVVYPPKLWTTGSIVASFFGAEGAVPGKFQRPWGVGCDRQGRLLVADRSNSRVQVLRDNGSHVFDFGKKGSGEGEFQLVSAVCGAPNGDLICVDKDNHRIQVFSENGQFKFSFGKLGGKPGEFHYPWDVDVNARGEIAVTDSRNRRIQFFDPSGKFIKAFENTDCPDMESPRGVCFINTNEVVVSDFDQHQLIVVNIRTKKHRVICKEGSQALKRPQGVAWHPQGFVVVGDSRNNRFVAMDLHGSTIWEFTGNHSNQGNLDRPCGVAVTKKGALVGVDFGNNRMVVLQ